MSEASERRAVEKEAAVACAPAWLSADRPLEERRKAERRQPLASRKDFPFVRHDRRSWGDNRRRTPTLAAKLARAEERIKVLEQDAMRYRWLRTHEWDSLIVRVGYDELENLADNELDAAIDAALAAGG